MLIQLTQPPPKVRPPGRGEKYLSLKDVIYSWHLLNPHCTAVVHVIMEQMYNVPSLTLWCMYSVLLTQAKSHERVNYRL